MEKKTKVFLLLTRDRFIISRTLQALATCTSKTWLPAKEVESLFPVPRAIQFLLHSYLALFFN